MKPFLHLSVALLGLSLNASQVPRTPVIPFFPLGKVLSVDHYCNTDPAARLDEKEKFLNSLCQHQVLYKSPLSHYFKKTARSHIKASLDPVRDTDPLNSLLTLYQTTQGVFIGEHHDQQAFVLHPKRGPNKTYSAQWGRGENQAYLATLIPDLVKKTGIKVIFTEFIPTNLNPYFEAYLASEKDYGAFKSGYWQRFFFTTAQLEELEIAEGKLDFINAVKASGIKLRGIEKTDRLYDAVSPLGILERDLWFEKAIRSDLKRFPQGSPYLVYLGAGHTGNYPFYTGVDIKLGGQSVYLLNLSTGEEKPRFNVSKRGFSIITY
jgi:hypothetical protein